jgi:hypothetical protein
MLDGKVVQFPAFEPGAVNGNTMGFVAHFTDGTAGAYLASIGATQLTAAVSRKTHGSAGTFDIDLPLTGTPSVECRSGGVAGNHTVVFAFSHSVVSGNASVTSGIGTVMGSLTFAANTMTVQLTGVTDAQVVGVTLSNVTDDIAQVLPNIVVSMGVLLGDTTANKSANASDVSQTKLRSGTAVNSETFRNSMLMALSTAPTLPSSNHAPVTLFHNLRSLPVEERECSMMNERNKFIRVHSRDPLLIFAHEQSLS